ncbi:hypothetical protein M8J75_010630 [Diaphorina citri]|nr:hypothetical protein M8J75_010630 [Diaphorina citri]
MGCVQSYFKRAQSSLSPSSTHDSDRKPLDDGSPIHEITRQPIGSIREESEDHGDGDHDKIEIRENNNNIPNESGERKSSLHCVGVEATAVRQLAASTGTVAILGTTAKPPMKKSASGNLIENENAENADIVEVVIEHNNIIQSNSGTLHQTIEAIAQEVRTDLIQNGVQKISKDETTKVENTAENEKTVNNNTIFVDENLNSTDQNAVDQPNLNKENYNAHITSELTNKVTEAISISEQNHISNVNIAPSNIDNQISQTQEVVTNKLESKLPESNIANYDSTVKAPSLEEKPSSEEVIVDNMDQSNTNIIPETRTNNNNVIDKQSKVPLAKHFKQEVNTSEVVKQKSKSSKESSLEKEITVRSFDKDRSIDSNNTNITNLSKTSSLEQHSENIDVTQSQIKTNNELTKLPSIESKAMLPTVADAVEDIIASATNIVLEKTKAKITEKPHSEVETFDTESKKSVSNDLDSDSNGTSDQTVISQESLNEENMREGVTNVTISKNTRNKSIELETEVKENDLVVNGELKDEIKKEILPDINGIIKEAEEHVNNYNYELTQILENGVPDEDSVSLISKNSFDKDEVSLKESIEKKPENEEKPPSIPELETIPKKVMRKDMSLSLTSQEESSIEISPENDVSNTVSETSDATKDIFTPHSGNSERTPHDETPLSEDRTPRVDFPLSDSMMDDLRKEIDGICDEAVARIATATTKIQAGYRGYKTRKSLKQTNNDIEGQGSFDGADLPPPDLERLGSIHEDDPLRGPPDEVPDFDTDPDFHVPPASTQSDSMSESLSSAATKIQAGVRGYLTRKQVKQGSSTTVPSDSDFSETSVTSQDPLRSSTDLETQVQRVEDPVARNFHTGKRMSLDSNLRQVRPYRPPLRSVMSERDDGEDESPDEIWRMLTQEADKAAVLIQSSFRGYQARKKLSRGDAVHMPTTSSSATPSSTRSEDKTVTSHRGTGEFHDSVFASKTSLKRNTKVNQTKMSGRKKLRNGKKNGRKTPWRK